MLTRIIGLGAGGHARVVVELLRAAGGFELVGLLDARFDGTSDTLLGVPILGRDDRLPDLAREGIRHFFVGLGTVGDASRRIRVFDFGRSHGLEAPTLVHPTSIVSPTTNVGAGTVVMAGAILNACARVGTNVIVNTGAIVEHDCIIEDHAHVATGARLAGGVHVGAGAHIGAGATIIQGVRVGAAAIVGAGAVVIRDVPENTTVVGVPARPLQSKDARGQS